MARKPKERAEASIQQRLTFTFRHVAVLHAIEQEINQSYRDRRILTNRFWHLESCGEGQGCCWVEFTNDEPFIQSEIDSTLHNIELMDSACEAMVTGTGAEAIT